MREMSAPVDATGGQSLVDVLDPAPAVVDSLDDADDVDDVDSLESLDDVDDDDVESVLEEPSFDGDAAVRDDEPRLSVL
jgi:hypothetical protein